MSNTKTSSHSQLKCTVFCIAIIVQIVAVLFLVPLIEAEKKYWIPYMVFIGTTLCFTFFLLLEIKSLWREKKQGVDKFTQDIWNQTPQLQVGRIYLNFYGIDLAFIQMKPIDPKQVEILKNLISTRQTGPIVLQIKDEQAKVIRELITGCDVMKHNPYVRGIKPDMEFTLCPVHLMMLKAQGELLDGRKIYHSHNGFCSNGLVKNPCTGSLISLFTEGQIRQFADIVSEHDQLRGHALLQQMLRTQKMSNGINTEPIKPVQPKVPQTEPLSRHSGIRSVRANKQVPTQTATQSSQPWTNYFPAVDPNNPGYQR